MTEFEEDLNKIVVEVETPIEKYIVEKAISDESLYAQHYEAVLEKFKDWHSPEYIEKEVQTKREKLPVVPECVADWYDTHKYNLEFDIYVFCGEFYKHSSRLTIELSDFEIWFDNLDNNPIETLIHMKNGYQIEKQKLFYLKNKLTGMYLYKKPLGGYGEEPTESIKFLTDDFKFTQKEINKMDAQGYEKEDEYKGE